MRNTIFHTILALALFISVSSTRGAEPQPDLWLYCPTNLLVPKNVDDLEKLWRRAAANGYNHVLLADSKFTRLGEMPREYFRNCDRVKKLAAELHVQIVPSVFPVGYSNDLLFHDPNLAEGLPVKDSLFEVLGGEAKLVADPPVELSKISFKDDSVSIDGNVATVHPGKGVARFNYSLNVHPYRCYHVSVMIRTKDLRGQPEIKALAEKWSLNWQNLGVKPTQDWTRHDVVFDSLDHQKITLYFGLWDNPQGELQWKDWKIEEVGLLNVIRRDGAPVTVKSDKTGNRYVEGNDYERIEDPHMGNDPWKGEYKSWHTPPTIRTKLPDGTRLRVSWYYPPIVYDGQVAACISEPKTMELLADQAKRMKELWQVPTYMMSHDEFRVFGWDESCEKRHLTPGQMLAENLRQCTAFLKPNHAAVWSDMFDPFHNAVAGPYYLVNGPWTGSWDGLDSDVLILNWNYGKRDQSLKFFADRGNQQVIAGYYDNNLSQWKNWLASARPIKGVVGYMYTTWRRDYSKLEEFAKMSRE